MHLVKVTAKINSYGVIRASKCLSFNLKSEIYQILLNLRVETPLKFHIYFIKRFKGIISHLLTLQEEKRNRHLICHGSMLISIDKSKLL